MLIYYKKLKTRNPEFGRKLHSNKYLIEIRSEYPSKVNKIMLGRQGFL